MTGPRHAIDVDLETVGTTSTTSTTERGTVVTAPASTDESTIVGSETVNDQDEPTHWHPAVPNPVVAVSAVSPPRGGGGC